MALDDTSKPPAPDRFEELPENAIAVAHARSFLSLDNQKVAGSRRSGRACACATVTHSPDGPALAGRGDRARTLSRPRPKLLQAAQRHAVAGLDGERGAVVGDGAILLAFLGVHVAAIGQRHSEPGVDRQRLVVVLERGIQIAAHLVAHAAVVVG